MRTITIVDADDDVDCAIIGFLNGCCIRSSGGMLLPSLNIRTLHGQDITFGGDRGGGRCDAGGRRVSRRRGKQSSFCRGATPHGLSRLAPRGTRQIRVPGGMQSTIESVTGPLISKDTIRRAVAARGHQAPLPMGLRDVPRLFGADRPSGCGAAVPRAAGAQRPRPAHWRKGQEERTYRQWVERRMGHGAYEHVYADYAVPRRAGLPGEQLAHWARTPASPHGSTRWRRRTAAMRVCIRRPSRSLKATAERFGSGVDVRGFKVVDGRVSAVDQASPPRRVEAAQYGLHVRMLSWRAGSVKRSTAEPMLTRMPCKRSIACRWPLRPTRRSPWMSFTSSTECAAFRIAGVRRRVHRGFPCQSLRRRAHPPTAHAFWRSERRWG